MLRTLIPHVHHVSLIYHNLEFVGLEERLDFLLLFPSTTTLRPEPASSAGA
jgi:hypothetical protein